MASVNVGRYLAQEIEQGRLTWDQYGGTHPKLPGNTLVANLVKQLLAHAWRMGCTSQKPSPIELPPPLDFTSFFRGRLVGPSDPAIEVSAEWQRDVPDWDRFTRQQAVSIHGASPAAYGRGGGTNYDFDSPATRLEHTFLPVPMREPSSIELDDGDWQTTDLLHPLQQGVALSTYSHVWCRTASRGACA